MLTEKSLANMDALKDEDEDVESSDMHMIPPTPMHASIDMAVIDKSLVARS